MLFTLLCPGCRNYLIHSDFPVSVLCTLPISPITSNMYRPFHFWFLKFRLSAWETISFLVSHILVALAVSLRIQKVCIILELMAIRTYAGPSERSAVKN